MDVARRVPALLVSHGSNRLQLDASSLVGGIHTLEVVTDKGIRTDRFVISR